MKQSAVLQHARIAALIIAVVSLSGCLSITRIQPVPLNAGIEDFIPALTEGVPAEKDFPPLKTEGLTDDEINSISLYRQYVRGVVNITSITIYNSRIFGQFPQEGTGSGSIIGDDGLVLTNYHVIKGGQSLIVTLYDGSNYEARVVGADPETDLALIRFDPQGRVLQTIGLGISEDLQVGQKVLALGNPYGLEGTLTTGIISGLHRPLVTDSGYLMQDLIQTDASINPGNSGGPLLDSSGKMIGVNTMIISPSGGSVGIGFSIPAKVVRRIIPELLENGKVERGWIDLVPMPVNAYMARVFELPVSRGILVSKVTSGGNADTAGLRGGDQQNPIRVRGYGEFYTGGDLITRVNGKEVNTINDYLAALEETRPGDSIDVVFLRDGAEKSTVVILTRRPGS